MRTTLTLEDRIERDLKELAHRSGKPFKTVVNETLRAGLAARQATRARKPYRLRPASLGGILLEVDLDKALSLSDSLEDEAVATKLDLRK